MFVYHCPKIKNNKGLMLIDLMISVMLSVLVVSLLLKIYIIFQRNYHLQRTLNVIHHDAKEASDLFKDEIHQAGHLGCVRLTPDFPVWQHPPYSITSDNKLIINQSGFSVKYAAFPNTSLIQDMTRKSFFEVTTNVKFQKGDVLIISSCSSAEIFIVASAFIKNGTQIITTLHPLHDLYKKDAEVSHLISNRFYISTSRHGKDNSLYVEDINHRKTELIEGMHELNIKPVVNNQSRIIGLDIYFMMKSSSINKAWHSYSALSESDAHA